LNLRRFKVSIGQYEHRSDDGITWSRHTRELPARHTPVVHGAVDLAKLPALSNDSHWDFVTLHTCGFGVAVNHKTTETVKSMAGIFVTMDGGQHWNQREAKPRLPLLRKRSWPVERFASAALTSLGVIALAWDDPWILDASRSHVICSQDHGESWEYKCLGYTNPYVALDHDGRLLALNDGCYIESRDLGRTWKKSDFRVDWPEGYNKKRVALIRCLIFPEAHVGYGLIVHWALDSTGESSPDVGLVTTTDNGTHWKHLHVFEAPNVGDINERHVLDLRVI
jgi:hypothetical protein